MYVKYTDCKTPYSIPLTPHIYKLLCIYNRIKGLYHTILYAAYIICYIQLYRQYVFG